MKKYLLIIMIVVLSLSLVACSGSALENYKVAMEKTNNMTKASESFEMKFQSEYNIDDLDEETQKMIELFQNITFTLQGSFDNELNKSMNNGYLTYGDFGYDFNIYGVDDTIYIEPFFMDFKDYRYIELSKEDFEGFEETENEASMEMFEKIGDKWNEIINEENVIKGEKVLITTDDGEVKSDEFTITLNDDQLKEFLLYVIELFEENDGYLNMMEESTYIKDEVEMTEVEKKELYEDIFESMKDFIINTEGLNLFYKAYIDVDNYVVQEDVKFSMDNDSATSGELIKLEFTMTNKYWNIEKDQNLNFETPTAENSIKLEDIDLEELFPQRGVN